MEREVTFSGGRITVINVVLFVFPHISYYFPPPKMGWKGD